MSSRKRPPATKKYTDKQKIEYYKKLAAARAYRGRPAAISGTGAYGSKRRAAPKKESAPWYAAPDSIGGTLGGWLGHGAQKIVKALTGFGDYAIEANSVLMGGMSPPQIVNSVNTGGVILRHREYISDIIASTSFTNQTFDINPGLYATFPWLSQVATAFELYRLRGLVFEFKSMSSDAVLSSSASSALGTVIMATQYNSLNAGFTSALQMENHEFANASKPSCDFYHPVECKKSLLPASELYIRDGAVPTGGDIRLFDIGQFNIATLGMQNATGVIGQLWCTYEVEFYQHAFNAPTSGILTDHIINASCTGGSPIGVSHSFATGNSLGLQCSTTSIIFPSSVKTGKFLILMRYIRASAAFVAPTITAPSTGTFNLLQYWDDGTNQDASTNGNSGDGTNTTFHLAYVIQIVGPNYPITVTWGTAGTISSSNMDMWVTQIDADVSN